jgi:sortase B
MAKIKTKKKSSGPLFLIIIIVLLMVIAVSLFNILKLQMKYQVGTIAYNNVAEQVDMKKNKKGGPNWKKLLKINEDTVAWLRCKGTVINYPVMQGEDNDFYLHHLITREYDFKGCLFVDANCDGKFRDFLTIIYGHHMRDGSMFHCLTDYMEMDYYRKHKTMKLFTPDKDFKLEVFAAAEVPADSPVYKVDFETEEEKAQYLDQVEAINELDADIEPTTADQIVMLSTCAYDFKNARMLVYCVMRPLD